VDLDFTREDDAFRQEVRTWLEENAPKQRPPREGTATREFDLAWQRKQYDGGWAGIAWPAEYGGRGLSGVRQLIWFEECARANVPEAGPTFVGLNHAGPTLIVNASDAQKAFHLPKILKGEVIWCQGFSEPGAGSDLGSLSLKGVVDGDSLVVTGSKIWTSYAHLADYQELLVRTDPDARKHAGITWIICDMKLPGITIRPIRFINGEHHFNQVFYDEARIPLANVVGEINKGWQVAMSTLAFERGTAFTQRQMLLAKLVDEVAERAVARHGGRSALLQESLGERIAMLKAETKALRAMTYLAVSRNARRAAPGPDGSLLKLQLSRLKKEAGELALEVEGCEGLLNSHIVKDYQETFARSVGGGTDEVQKNIVAQRLLGLPRQY